MLLMVEKGIRGGICYVMNMLIHRYAEANNKYLKDFDKNLQFTWFGNVGKASSK